MRLLIHSYFLTKQCCYIDCNKGMCFTESYSSQGQKERHKNFKIHSKMYKKLSNKFDDDWHNHNWFYHSSQAKAMNLAQCSTETDHSNINTVLHMLAYWHLERIGGHTSELLCSPESHLKETWSKLTNTWFSWRIVTSSIMTKKPIKQSIKQITKYTISKTTHSVIVVNINLMQ